MKKLQLIFAFSILLGLSNQVNAQAFTFTSGQLTYPENFDGMTPTGTNYLPGWTGIRYAGTGDTTATLVMVVGDGTGNSGAVYNVGTTGAADRAFGTLASGSTIPRIGAYFLNNTGSTIVSVNLAGVMEQWRSASSNSVNEICAFQYSLDASSMRNGNWTAVPAFDLVEKLTASTTAAGVDGNLPDNQTAISASISNIAWTPGSTLWIRWSDINDSGSDGLYSIDNLVVTVSTGSVTVDPEPSNYPNAFAASAAGLTINTTWADAAGTQLPAAYLVKISKNQNIATPVDGIYEADDLNLADGNGAKNVAFGQQHYTFAGLTAATVYYLKIFPYTNSGTLIDYKTDGTAPAASATTQTLIHSQNFDTDLLPWTEYSVTGDQIWAIDTIHGVGNTRCAKMSGYSGAAIVNEDWLISPSINLTGISDVKLLFYTAYNYAGNPLTALISTNYNNGNPTTATWNDISASAIFSPGGWAWTPSGFINLSVANQGNVHIAFKYTSDNTAASTWEVDEVMVTGSTGVGFGENPVANGTTQIFPNPCEDWFTANFQNSSNYRISIVTVQGSIVKTVETTDKICKVETAGLPEGLYLVIIENLKTSQKEVRKLIIN